MTTHATGTVIDGQLQLDQPINLPNQSRVSVTVQTAPTDLPAELTAFASGIAAWKKLIEEHPVRSGGLRFTRDELHERD